jgi:hypothetical protein
MSRTSLTRALAGVLLTAAVVLGAVTSAASATTLPPLVAKNIPAITALEYKMLSIEPNGRKLYPSCTATCRQLWRPRTSVRRRSRRPTRRRVARFGYDENNPRQAPGGGRRSEHDPFK